MQTREQSLDLLKAVKKTLAGATGDATPASVDVRKATYLSCIATTLLVIAYTLLEKDA